MKTPLCLLPGVSVSACVVKLFEGTEVPVLTRAQRSVWLRVLRLLTQQHANTLNKMLQ